MVTEYITKEQAIAAAKRGIRISVNSFVSTKEEIEAIKAADVRPVVLCKDCDHWNEWDHVGRETLGNFRCSCAYWSHEDGPIYYTGENDFCSYGERKEADG